MTQNIRQMNDIQSVKGARLITVDIKHSNQVAELVENRQNKL